MLPSDGFFSLSLSLFIELMHTHRSWFWVCKMYLFFFRNTGRNNVVDCTSAVRKHALDRALSVHRECRMCRLNGLVAHHDDSHLNAYKPQHDSAIVIVGSIAIHTFTFIKNTIFLFTLNFHTKKLNIMLRI